VPHAEAPARALEDIRRIGHRFGSARKNEIDVADARRLDRVDDRLQAGSADAIDGLARHFLRHPRFDRRLARDVHPRARLQDAPHDDVAEIDRLDVRAANRFLDDDGAEIGGGEILERAAERSDRRAAGADDDCGFVIGHIQFAVGPAKAGHYR